jgi:hypothetical protein
MKLINFNQINDEDEFCCGATFRKMGTCLSKVSPEDNFYEYMLFLDMSNMDYMICAHIDKLEAGTVCCLIPKTKDLGRHTITAKEFKRMMILPEEMDTWFYVEGEVRKTRIVARQK